MMQKRKWIIGILLALVMMTKATATATEKADLKSVEQLITCSLGKSEVRLEWKGVEGTKCYRISRTDSKGKGRVDLAEIKGCSFTDKTLEYDKEYIYYVTPLKKLKVKKIVEIPMVTSTKNSTSSAIEILYGTVKEVCWLEGQTSEISFSNKKVVATDHQKYSYTEMQEDIAVLNKKYNGLLSYSVVGKSADGRAIYDVVIGNPKAKKTLLVVSTLHAREYMCSLLTMNQIEYYLENYNKTIQGKKISSILEEVCIHYVPMTNPDGVSISQEGFDAIKDKTLRDKLKKMGGNTTRWKANARGVDLNRNFPFDFRERGTIGAEGYSGPSAASEPEVKAVVKLVDTLKKNNGLQAVVNYHAMGSIIFNGIAGCSEQVAADLKRMYKDAQSVTKYEDAQKYYRDTLVGSYGNSKEYYTCVVQVPSITIEIGREAAPGPIEEFATIWNENKDVVIRQAALFY